MPGRKMGQRGHWYIGRTSMAYAPIQSIVAGQNSQLGDLHSQMGNEGE